MFFSNNDTLSQVPIDSIDSSESIIQISTPRCLTIEEKICLTIEEKICLNFYYNNAIITYENYREKAIKSVEYADETKLAFESIIINKTGSNKEINANRKAKRNAYRKYQTARTDALIFLERLEMATKKLENIIYLSKKFI